MDNRSSLRLSAYALNLDADAQKRYEAKVAMCGGVDPLLLGNADLCPDAALMPTVEDSDIKDFLVHATSFVTHDQFKAAKSLGAHNYLTSGFVQQPQLKQVDDRVIVRGKVNHSQALSTEPLEPWLLVKQDGKVLAAHCTCMAGLGEACSHISAVLYYLEAAVRHRDGEACTDKENGWLPPYLSNVPPMKLSQIDFASATMKKRRLDGTNKPSRKKTKTVIEKPSDQEWNTFLKEIRDAGTQPAVLSVTAGYCNEFIPMTVKYSAAILANLTRNKPATWDEVQEESQMFAQAFKVETEACVAVEKATKQQASSAMWFTFRTGRITASTAHAVCRTSLIRPSVSTVKRICYPEEHTFFSPSTDWGRRKEDLARRVYVAEVSKEHISFKCEAAGLHISADYPYMAASPDGLISCACCGDGLLEIKCPYSAGSVQEVVKRKDGCLECPTNGSPKLKKSHAYFCQVQVQMLACRRNYCDFMVWTPLGWHVERISFDYAYCMEVAQSCKSFFEKVLLPELMFKHWTVLPVESTKDSDKEEEEGGSEYCYCGGEEYGNMVECSGKDCRGKWFHFSCAKLKRAPKAKVWYCRDCKPQKTK